MTQPDLDPAQDTILERTPLDRLVGWAEDVARDHPPGLGFVFASINGNNLTQADIETARQELELLRAKP